MNFTPKKRAPQSALKGESANGAIYPLFPLERAPIYSNALWLYSHHVAMAVLSALVRRS